VGIIWCAGVALGGSAVLVGLWRTAGLRRGSQRLGDAEWCRLITDLSDRLRLRRAIELREHAAPIVPLTWGIFHPAVLLPSQARTWSEPLRRAVLLHELAHVQRGDVACQLLGRVACLLYWFHPLAWYGLRQLRQEREQACDDAVVQSGEKASDYAEQLLQVAKLCRAPDGLSLVVAMAEEGSLERRMISMFDTARSHGPVSRILTLALLLASSLTLAVVAIVHPVSIGVDRSRPADGRPKQPTIEPLPSPDGAPRTAPQPAQAAAPSPAKGDTITGRIVDDKQRGIGGAVVALAVYLESPSENPRVDTGRIIATAYTDSEGSYKLSISSHELKRQEGGIWAKAKGHAATRDNSYILLSDLAGNSDSVLTLAETEGARIQVLDSAGAPLAGVRVITRKILTREGPGYALPDEWHDASIGTTNAEGIAQLPHVHPEALQALELVVAGKMGSIRYSDSFFLNVRPERASPHFTLRLPQTGSLHGRLVVADGAALPANLELTLVSYPEGLGGSPPGVEGIVRVPVAANGEFHAAKLAVGTLFVPAFLPEDQPLRASLPANVVVLPNEATNLDIPVARGVRLRGRIQKSDSKAGVKGYGLSVIYGPCLKAQAVQVPWQKFDLVTDADGQFQCFVPPGPINLRLGSHFHGYRAATHWLPREQRGTWGPLFSVPHGESFDLPAIDLVKSISVKGRLVDMRNHPLADWNVYGYPQVLGLSEFLTMSSVLVRGPTDPDGTFTGSYPETYPPAAWKASRCNWKTPYESDDDMFAAKIISHEPLILQVDPSAKRED
jgi:beta-lactamase regulating signal transducer with metallopeptidase domain